MQKSFVGRSVSALVVALCAVLCSAPPAHATNVALGKPALADVNIATAGNVSDGNYSTSWNNNGSPAAPSDFVGVDLGAATSIKAARIFWSAQPTGLTIDVATSVDTDPNDVNYGIGDWTTVYQRTTSDPQPNNPELIDLTKDSSGNPQSLSYRFIRISGTDLTAAGSANWGVNEFQVLDAVLPVISGTATHNGSPVSGALISLSGPAATPNGPPTISATTTTDAGGHYSFTGLDDGSYSLIARDAGLYAPVNVTVNVAGANVNQPINFTGAVFNFSNKLPAYSLDDIATAANKKNGNATSSSLVLPADELPAGDALWSTATTLPLGTGDGAGGGGQVGPNLPKTLNFYFPPTADGNNNVLTPTGATIFFPTDHYSALYFLQACGDRDFYTTTATLFYDDGTSAPVTTSSGSTTYRINPGVPTVDANGNPIAGTGVPGEDEVVAFSVDKLYNVTGSGSTVPESTPFSVFMRTVYVDSTKTLTKIVFGSQLSTGTIQSPFIYAYSADALTAPPAVGSISGTIKAPASAGGGPVANAFVTLQNYRISTDATGTYKFNGLPAGTYTVTANKPANYPATPVTATLAAGENKTVDIQFTNAIPVITDRLTGPSLDMISSDNPDGSISLEWSAANNIYGAEYLPTGLYSPNTVPDPAPIHGRMPGDFNNTPNWTHDPSAPGALAFDFGPTSTDSPIAPGQPGAPIGGVPNVICLHDAEILAPQVAVANAYLAVNGLNGTMDLTATLNYTDGTSTSQIINVSDWFSTALPDELPYVNMHGRHGSFVPNGTTSLGTQGWVENSNGMNPNGVAPASIGIKAIPIPVNSAKILHDITFDHGDYSNRYPLTLAISWETVATPQPSSDIRVTVKQSDGSTPAAGAWVVMGPYSKQADSNGQVIFYGVAAGQHLDIGAFLSGLSKQALAANHLVAAGQKMPTPDDISLTLPSAAPTFIPLRLAYDFDNVATTDMPGDYHAQAISGDAAFAAESIPASNAIVTDNNVDFLMPHTETGYLNLLRSNGQTLQVAPGHYSALDFVVLGQGVSLINSVPGGAADTSNVDPAFHHVTLNFSDGTHDQVIVANQDWTTNYRNKDTVAHRLFYREQFSDQFQNGWRRTNTGDGQTSLLGFAREIVPINAAKTLSSITLDRMYSNIGVFDFSYLSATLEANDVTTTATLTGTVTGKPLGADGNPVATAVPLANIMVGTDPGHTVYTDANGNFTLPDVPPSSTSVTITPLGTGILTKSVPVTLTAGANALGTLNAGTAVTQVSVILGSTNTENGLKQVQGYTEQYATLNGSADNGNSISDSPTTVVTLPGGGQARAAATAAGYMYFSVDRGWLFRGYQGANGLTVTGAGTPSQQITKLAPHIYMRIEYLDRGTDPLSINYNRMQMNTNSTYGIPTYNMIDSYRTPQIHSGSSNVNENITKTNTNTLKTFVFDLNPDSTLTGTGAPEAFGAYHGENALNDFRIDPVSGSGGQAEVIKSVILSTTSTFTTPTAPSAIAALREAGGLATTTPADVSNNDVTGPAGTTDGKVTILDAVKLARSGQL